LPGLNVTTTETVLFGFTPVLDALALNPAPVAVTDDIATFAVPESVSVTVLLADVPTVTLPNARLVVGVVKLELGGTVPVPVTPTVRGLLLASLLIVRVPCDAPVTVGSNFTVYVTVSLGLSGAVELAVTLNPAPEIVAVPSVTGAVPESLTTTGMVEDEPTVTLPKVKVVELGESCEVPVTPIPVSMMFIDASDASLEIVRVPWLFPVPLGVNITTIVVV
jgi:hypothetical protein